MLRDEGVMLPRVAMRERLRHACVNGARDPRAILLVYLPRRRVSVHCSRRCCFCVPPRGSGGKRGFACLARAHYRRRVRERERPRNRVHSRNVVLRITKLSYLPPAGESVRVYWNAASNRSPQRQGIVSWITRELHAALMGKINF